jgi:hypothetical protein
LSRLVVMGQLIHVWWLLWQIQLSTRLKLWPLMQLEVLLRQAHLPG